nr:MAG: hypothetical protein 1 [Leviviridae sp.]
MSVTSPRDKILYSDAATAAYKGYWRAIYPTGACYSFRYAPYTSPGYLVRYGRLTDYVTSGKPWPINYSFDLTKYYLEPIRVNGCAGPTYGRRYHYFDWRSPGLLAIDQIDNYSDRSLDWGPWETEALGKFNPNVPVVDVPLFLFELKDIPRMIKHAVPILRSGFRAVRDGLNLPGKREALAGVSDSVLAYNLGWKPLVNDLIGLTFFCESVNERIQFLKSLARSKRRSHRMAILNKTHNEEVTWTEFPRAGKFSFHTTKRVWAEFGYELDISSLPDRLVTDYHDVKLHEMREGVKLLKQYSGFTASWQTAWNALPWSFLIDYIIDVDGYLQAHRGGIPWNMHGLWLTCNIEQKSTFSPTTYSLITNPGKSWYSGKHRRYVAEPRARVYLEKALTNTQISNVSALSIRKFLL